MDVFVVIGLLLLVMLFLCCILGFSGIVDVLV